MSCVRSINCLCIGRCSLFCNQFIIYCQQKARHGVSPSYLQILFHASSSSQSIFCIFPSPPQFFIALVSLVVSLIQFGYIRIYHDMPIIFHHVSIIFPAEFPASSHLPPALPPPEPPPPQPAPPGWWPGPPVPPVATKLSSPAARTCWDASWDVDGGRNPINHRIWMVETSWNPINHGINHGINHQLVQDFFPPQCSDLFVGGCSWLAMLVDHGESPSVLLHPPSIFASALGAAMGSSSCSTSILGNGNSSIATWVAAGSPCGGCGFWSIFCLSCQFGIQFPMFCWISFIKGKDQIPSIPVFGGLFIPG